jgi:VanZ family protein
VKRSISLWAAVLLYAGFIFYFSSLPSTKLPSIGNYDKIIHVFEFLILGFLLSRAFDPDKKARLLKVFILASIVSALYGISDEIHQLFTLGREFSFGDMIVDGIGGMLGSTAYWLLKTRINRILD